ncbi:hypothetical protein M3M33_16985, partial [Loigolactobacillus coryniformis]|uniref:PKD domain-containing protein n=1 Tax=Loigolactobacillus coryniformis TaxID=1610 RepID=UPI00201A6799
DQIVGAGDQVTLDGGGSVGDGTLTYTWTQISGPDVTGGIGTLSGINPTFVAPLETTTLTVELVVSNGTAASTPDTVIIT